MSTDSVAGPELLSVATTRDYLVTRGIIDASDKPAIRELGGGVSNVVLAVETERHRLVVKQALPRLRVADEWLAKRERALAEAAALAHVWRLRRDRVPELVDVDEEACALTITMAPPGWLTWKELLLGGTASPRVAFQLGEFLALLHTPRTGRLAACLDDAEAFDQLRVEPYYRTAMRRNPQVSSLIASYVERMVATRRSLVHGDYSPKNVLLGGDGLWIVDFEVAHMGDPAFDIAFMLNHLMLKAIHRPASLDSYRRSATAFWHAYFGDVSRAVASEPPYVLGHVGCLMLARVDGKSSAEYLTEDERRRAKRIALALLVAPPGALDEAWRHVAAHVR